MSRIGKMPITVPAGVDITVNGSEVTVKGPKGTLTRIFHPDMIIRKDEGFIHVERPSEEKFHKSLHGLTRTLIANMVLGVTTGFKKELDINGVGYRAIKQGSKLVMNLGYSHQVEVEEIPGIAIDVPAPNKIIISGADKQQVGQFAAEVREKRPPEPYKGKGIKYADEVVRRKEGKAGKGAKGAKK
ncbi:MAG: 50S ribosomal protein L6 [Clostridia bacterium]|nr:50S ribosomal protein L6 [Clostridia bacterium]MDR3644613.1 50S ribosomal protein L6 [Clostridia bacterium]